MSEINSKDYWDYRFSSDWEKCQGREQSKFFAELTIQALPEWFIKEVRCHRLSICDWGCALGDGTKILANFFPDSNITGVDFSPVATQIASKEYNTIRFLCEDWLQSEPETDISSSRYDVVFSSNTFEHFCDPSIPLAALFRHANIFIVLTLPFREINRIEEHQYTFLANNIMVNPSNDFLLVHAKVINTAKLQPTYWGGEQIVLIYARTDWLHANSLTLSELNIDCEQTMLLKEKFASLNQALAERDAQVVSHKQAVVEREDQIVRLNQMVAERDDQIARLKKAVAESDEQIASLNQALAERDEQIQKQIQDILAKERMIQQIKEELSRMEERLRWKRYRLADRLIAGIWYFYHPNILFGKAKQACFNLVRFFFRCLPLSIQWRFRKMWAGFSQLYLSIRSVGQYCDEVAINFKSGNFGIGKQGLVSIVLPVYNQSEFLREAVSSVLNQTYENFELIIVNDGSTDGDVEHILDELVSHPKIKILHHTTNQGLPKALNTGFRYASGEFWTWTSADNIMLPEQLEKHVNFLHWNPDVAMVYSDYIAIDDQGHPLKDPNFRPHNRESIDSPVIRLPRSTDRLNDVKDNFIGPCFMYRAWAGKVMGQYDPQFMGAEDYDYWMRINSLFRICHLNSDEILYKYRVHENTLNARAKELGIFERVDQLMKCDKKRRNFYNMPFSLYLDDKVRSWLGAEVENLAEIQRCYNLQQWHASNTEQKAILMVTGESHSWLQDFVPYPKAFVGLIVEPKSCIPYALSTEDWSKIDACFALDELTAHRLRLFKGEVFQVSEPKDLMTLATALTNRTLFERISGHKEDSIAPVFWLPKQSKAKIVIQVDNFDKGGLERVVYNLACHVDRSRVEPIILVTNRAGVFAEKARQEGVHVITLDQHENGRGQENYTNILRSIKADLVNAHYSTYGLEEVTKLNLPIIQTIHNSYVWLRPDQIALYQRLESAIKKYSCVSNNVAKYSDLRLHLSVSRMIVIPNGIDVEELGPPKKPEVRNRMRQQLDIDKDEFVFLCTSAFYIHKMQYEIVQAFARVLSDYPKTKLLFLGEPADQKYYQMTKNLADSLGLSERVMFLGYQGDPSLFYRAADAFLIPSAWEGWSLALAEALYFGLPVIATNVGAACELISESGLGILLPSVTEVIELDCSNLDSKLFLNRSCREELCTNLTHAMLAVIERGYTEQERSRGAELILEKYTAKRMAGDYEQLFFESLL